MIKQIPILLIALTTAISAFSQAMYDAMGKVPEAVCKVAPLPKAMAEAKAKLEKEKAQKLIRQGYSVPNVSQKVLANKNLYVTNGSNGNQRRRRCL